MKIKTVIKYFALGIFMLIVHLKSIAQIVSPQEGAYLNYTDIIFEVDQISTATSYIFTFFECNKRGENCKPIQTITSANRAMLVTNLFDFDKSYAWSFIAKNKKKEVYQSKLFSFQTGTSHLLDTSLQRYEWTIKNKKRKKGIILIDGLKLALNMQGKPVFYLNYKFDHTIRDINITKQGTITMVDNRMGEIKEVAMNGEMIWIGPNRTEGEFKSGDKFHHEFEKLDNKNYLVAGKKKLSEIESDFDFSNISGNTLCETIIEFDFDRNEVWRFNLLPELKKQFNIAPTSQMFSPDRLGHLNGLAAEKNNKFVYASFKTFSSVFKIEKETNTILYMYGNKKIDFKDSVQPNLAFEQQHCPVIKPNGNLLILNNGNEKTGSGVVELNANPKYLPEQEIKKSVYFKGLLKKDFYTAQMGSVQYIDKKNVLVGLGNAGHLFELNFKRKKINWQLYTFQNIKKNENSYLWKPLISYRVNYYSSLYPYYFIVDKWMENNNKSIKIVNIGSEKENFTIQVWKKNNSENYFIKPITIKGSKSATIALTNDVEKVTINAINQQKSLEISVE